MSSSLLSRSSLFASGLVVLLLAATVATRANTAPLLPTLDYTGYQQALAILDREIAAAGTDTGQLATLAARLTETLRAPDTTQAARQAVAQRLCLFPAPALANDVNAAFFTAMLADEKQVNIARLALDLVPGESIDALYIRALEKAAGSAPLALAQSIGNRRIAAGVAPLSRLLNAPDAPTAAAAAKALGQIGTAEALAALRSAPNAASAEGVAARLAAAEQLGGAAAIREFQDIAAIPEAPAHLRAAATRGLLFAEPATAPERFVAALGSGDRVLTASVLEAIHAHPSSQVVVALAAQLATWDAPTQEAVIVALGRKGDAAAVAAVSEATRHSDSAVRAAAISALGELPGSPETAVLLARLAAGGDPDSAQLARQSLARLDGPGVADAVLTGAMLGEGALRVVFLEQIASRNMTPAIALLLKSRGDPSADIRVAALGSLAEIAPASTQRAILDWAIAASTPAEQSRALRALANVTLRNDDVVQRASAIIEAIEHAPSATAVQLLPVLPRIGGAASAECAARLGRHDDPAVANAAASTLARWTDPLGFPGLVDVAENARHEQTRATAVRGAVQYLSRARDFSPARLTPLVARLIGVAPDDASRARLVYFLSRTSDADALALAEKLKADPTVAGVAGDTVLAILSNRAGAPVMSATAGEAALPNLIDGKLNTRWGAHARLGQSIQLDFHSTRPVRQVVLDGADAEWGHPEKVDIFVTEDPTNPGAPLASAHGQRGKTTIDLPAGTRGRYLIVRHSVDNSAAWWSIAELIVD